MFARSARSLHMVEDKLDEFKQSLPMVVHGAHGAKEGPGDFSADAAGALLVREINEKSKKRYVITYPHRI
jgi:hypothetical protein